MRNEHNLWVALALPTSDAKIQGLLGTTQHVYGSNGSESIQSLQTSQTRSHVDLDWVERDLTKTRACYSGRATYHQKLGGLRVRKLRVFKNKRYQKRAVGKQEPGLTKCREGSMLRVCRIEKPVRNSDVDLALSIRWSQDTDGRSRGTERLCRASQ